MEIALWKWEIRKFWCAFQNMFIQTTLQHIAMFSHTIPLVLYPKVFYVRRYFGMPFPK